MDVPAPARAKKPPSSDGRFQKGQSGNPGGNTGERQAAIDAAKALAVKHVHKAFELHIAVLDRTIAAKNAGVPIEEWAEIWPKSADFIADRALGKPKQATELTGAEGGPIVHEIEDTRRPVMEYVEKALAEINGTSATKH